MCSSCNLQSPLSELAASILFHEILAFWVVGLRNVSQLHFVRMFNSFFELVTMDLHLQVCNFISLIIICLLSVNLNCRPVFLELLEKRTESMSKSWNNDVRSYNSRISSFWYPALKFFFNFFYCKTIDHAMGQGIQLIFTSLAAPDVMW